MDGLVDEAVGDAKVLGEPASEADITGGQAALFFAQEDARGDARLAPAPVDAFLDEHGSFMVGEAGCVKRKSGVRSEKRIA
jgi:hypothetical protein